MKKTIFTLIVLIAISLTACHKDCVCKYYRKGKLYDVKTWKEQSITKEECEGMSDRYTMSVPIGDYTQYELVDFSVVCERSF